MNTSEPRRVNATDNETESFSQSLRTFTSTVTELLAEADVTDDDDVAALTEASEQLVTEAKEIEATVTANDEEQERAARERADIRADLHETKQTVEADETDDEAVSSPSDPKGQADETTLHKAVTPLGDVVTLPETLAEQELTANIKRSRDVAADVVDYGRSVPAGYAVTSSELRTVLTAMKDGDGKAYTETVGRVIGYLDELGGDDVQVKETMGGERTVIFSEAFVKRTVAWRNGRGNEVVAGMEATG